MIRQIIKMRYSAAMPAAPTSHVNLGRYAQPLRSIQESARASNRGKHLISIWLIDHSNDEFAVESDADRNLHELMKRIPLAWPAFLPFSTYSTKRNSVQEIGCAINWIDNSLQMFVAHQDMLRWFRRYLDARAIPSPDTRAWTRSRLWQRRKRRSPQGQTPPQGTSCSGARRRGDAL